MQAIFGDAELTRWVLRKPSTEELDVFYDWRYHIFAFLTPFPALLFRKKLTIGNREFDDVNSAKSDPHEILELLQHIQQFILFESHMT